MRNRNRTTKPLRFKLIALAVAACFASDPALANPTGPTVVNGTVNIQQTGNLLQITNSPSSIINWQSFSIGANEITRFLQQSNSSAILNRVTTQNPSSILGALQSNGRVFLINPSGILFGAGSQIDVAGLVASTLNLSDADFLAGRMRFTDGLGAGSVVNQGNITTPAGGNVYLVGPAVTNSGIITSPQGEVVLAAGNTVELVNPGTPNLRVEITAPDNQAVNLGQIIADSGRVGIYAGLINQSGTVRANTAVVTEDGRIVLKATGNANLNPGSVTTASGPLEIEAGEILVAGNVTSGPQTINAGGGLLVQSTPGNFAQLTSTGGQTINAGFVEVTASGGGASITNFGNGDQVITTSGMNAFGEGLALRGGIGGFANIGQNVAGGQQVINVNNADRVTIDGAGGNALIFENSGVQTLRISGTGANALNLGSAGALGFSRLSGGTQTITAGVSGQQGSITIRGNPTGSGGPTNIESHPASVGGQTVSTSGMLTVLGGSATAGTNTAGVFSNVFSNSTGGQIINAEGITLQGGSSGSGNGAFINANNGSQQITVGAGGITLIGGAGGANNHALLRQRQDGGSQTITVNGGGIALRGGAGGTTNNAHILQVVTGVPSGSQTITVNGGGIALQGGAGGTNNGALMTGAAQDISATGNVTLSGGLGSGSSSIIGSQSGVATNLLLSAGGDVVLTGGSAAGAGALIGNTGAAPLQPTNIAITAGGDVILNGGTGSGARIGSSINAPAAGGDISISAGGSIELNGSSTQAARLRTLGNVMLHADNPGGMISETLNSVIQANALTTTSNAGTILIGQNEVAVFNGSSVAGNVALNNTSPQLTVTGVTALPGSLTLNQTGDLVITGNVTSGPQIVTVGGGLIVESSAAGPAQLSATGGQTINAGFIEVTAQDNNSAGISNATSGNQIITVAGGGTSAGIDVQSLASGGSASIANNAAGAAQAITVTDADHINVNGFGPNISNVSAIIHAIPGTQTISITGSGANAINVGSAGALGGSNINARSQSIVAGASGQSGSITVTGSAVNTRFAAISTNAGFPGSQTVSTSGALTVTGGSAPAQNFSSGITHNSTGPQAVTAAGITLQGGLSGSGNGVQIRSGSGDQTISASSISITGGSVGNSSFAEIAQTGAGASQVLTVTGGGTLALQGGSGGSNNFARIRNEGVSQQIDFPAGGAIVLSGGSGVSNDFAHLRANTGTQTITGLPTIQITGGTGGLADSGNNAQIRAGAGLQTIAAGDTTLTAGASGFSNGTTISSPTQVITIDGDLTLTGGGSANGLTGGGAARIGGTGATLTGGVVTAPPGSTNLTLDVSGDVTLTAGSVAIAAIGSSTLGGTAPASIAMTVGGDLTLNTGLGAGVRIGSSSTNLAPGNIVINAGTSGAGDIVLNGNTGIRTLGEITVSTPDNLTLTGGTGTNRSAQILSAGNQTVSANNIKLTGGSVGNSSFAEIFQTGSAGSQAVTASSIELTGGASGANNHARIRHQGFGLQSISGSPAITLTGGTGGAPDLGNTAQIIASVGPQTITAGDTTLTAGGAGFNNFATIQSPMQNITVHGDLTLTGGASASSAVRGGEARIGGLGVPPGTPSHLLLTVDGDVTMTGGSVANAGAVIGSGFLGGQPTDITMNIGRNLTMNPGTVAMAGSRIGSPSGGPAGGTIIVNAGTSGTGNIVMNTSPGLVGSVIRTTDSVTLQANAITQAAGTVIQAGSLTSSTANGASLTGANQVSAFNATNTLSGDIALDNVSPLLTVTGVSQVPLGALAISQAGDLAIVGNVTSGPQTINAGGGLLVQSTPGSFAQLTSTGGQTINAGFVEVTALGAGASIANNGSGDQIITTTGTNAAGEGLAVRTLGGIGAFANISQNAAGGQQVINVNNADRVVVDGAGGGALISANFFNSQGQGQGLAQTLSVTGAGANAINIGSAGALGASIVVGGSQNIVAGASGEAGSITIVGSATNGQLAGFVNNGQQNVSTSGVLSVTGGSASAQPFNFPAGIFHNGAGQQEVSAAGITLVGGPSGSGNSAHIGANTGSQQITVGAGGITITGGTGDVNNFAEIRQNDAALSQTITVTGGGIALQSGAGGTSNSARILQGITGVPSGSQTITVNGGDITLQGGIGGTNNNVLLFGANQSITATGDVILSGGPGSGNSSIIGSPNGVATNLVLSAGGDVVLTGGSAAGAAALIGTATGPLLTNNIAINAGGNVILNAGSGSGARIGSSINAPAAGGDISISAGGSIELNGSSTQAARLRTLGNVMLHADNPGGMISETPNSVIEANALTTTSSAGTSLIGANQVAAFNATNISSGDIALNNSGNLSATASNAAPGGKIAINNLVGSLSTSGPIAASGGGAADVALSAAGAVNIAHGVTATGTGDITLAGGAITVDGTSVVAGGSVTVNAASLDVKGTSSHALIEAGDGFDATLSGGLRVRADATSGGIGGWSAITADGPVNISAGSVAIEGGKKLGGFAAITGGPVNVTTTGDLSIAGGSGLGSFGMLLSDRNIGLTVGGSLRLDSGTGFGSFARVQTLSPGSTIGVHFPDLASGGYFVNGVEGRVSQGLSGFFTGVKPAKLGKTLITTYGE